MDLNALMQAAQSDPQAAQFIQQLLSGGTPMSQRLPEIKPFGGDAPEVMQMPEQAPLPVFDPAKNAMDKLLSQWDPAAAATAASQQPVGPQQGPTPGGSTLDQMQGPVAPPVGADGSGALAPGGEITQTPLGLSPEQQQQQLGQGSLPPGDLISLLQRMVG